MTGTNRYQVDAAQEVLASSGRTFDLASRLLSKGMRRDAALLYAFCRHMDDIADEENANGAIHLEEMARLLRVEPLSDAATEMGWPAALESRYRGISKIAAELVTALSEDTKSCRMTDAARLDQYAYGVAGTVGLMMCRILGAPPEGAKSASDLGMAMQFTNIARDVCEDLGRDRIYLPAQWVRPDQVRASTKGRNPEILADALLTLLQAADRLYASADQGMGYLPWRPRVAILAAAGCYREIGVIVRRSPGLSWKKRVVVPRSRKAFLVLRAVLRSFFYLRPPIPARGHAVSSRTAPATHWKNRT